MSHFQQGHKKKVLEIPQEATVQLYGQPEIPVLLFWLSSPRLFPA